MNTSIEFKECPQCASKPGFHELCPSCLHNRKIISELKSVLKRVIEDVEEKLLSINMASNHQWLFSHENSKDKMFMACIKDCRRLSREALDVLKIYSENITKN